MKKIKLFLYFLLLTFPFSLTFGQSWLWAKSFQCGNDDYPVATDKVGNIYKLIFVPCSIDTFTTGGVMGLFKLSPSGNVLNATSSNSIIGGYLGAICTDDSNNVIESGNYKGNFGFGTTNLSSPGKLNMYLAKFNSSGNIRWLKSSAMPINSPINPSAMTSDNAGNIYITGTFSDTIIFDTDTIKSFTRYGNFFLVKYSENGNAVWAKSDSINCSSCVASGTAIATDPLGNVYVTGNYDKTVSFDTFTLNQGTDCAFIVKYNTSGQVKWAKTNVPNSIKSYSSGSSIAIDNNYNTYFSGWFTDTITIGGIRLIAPAGVTDNYLAKMDSSGRVLWAKNFISITSNSNYFDIYSVVYNKWNYIYVCGGMEYPFMIDGDTITAPYITSDASFILKFDTAGNLLCHTTVASGGDDANAIAPDPLADDVYFSGDASENPAIFGNDSIYGPLSGEYPFLAKWSCNSTKEGINSIKHISNVSVFPNPFSNSTTISIDNEQLTMNNYLELYDLTGRVIKQIEFTGNTYTLSAEGLAKGMYFVRVFACPNGATGRDKDNNMIGTSKIVVQ